jgi:hypothetical protein
MQFYSLKTVRQERTVSLLIGVLSGSSIIKALLAEGIQALSSGSLKSFLIKPFTIL